MTDISFSQPERRNYAVPILVALVILCAAAGLIYRTFAKRVVIATVTHTTLHPITIKFKKQEQKGSFKVLGGPQSESDLYIIPSLRIENHLAVPLFLKDFTVTMNLGDGELRTMAIEKNDLGVVYASFPEMKPLVGTPLLRETEIAPGQTVEGTLLAQFPVAQSVWDGRRSASITIDFYHQDSTTIPIPAP